MDEKRIEIKIDANKLKGFLVFRPVSGNTKPVTSDEIMDALRLPGIKFGIREDKIQEFVMNPVAGVPYQVVVGTPPQHGKDAEILYNFDFEMLQTYSSGKILKSQRGIYRTFLVKKGQMIAKKAPATEGSSGKDIFATEIPPKPGKDKSLIAQFGRNIAVDESGTKAYATAEGILKYEGEKVHVDEVLVFPGDLDVDVGTIEFEGSVIVEGMVIPGTLIKARDNIQIAQVVEASTLIAGHDIEIAAGVKGRGKAYICAGRDIKARFVENAELIAGRDVLVDSAIMNSNVKAKRNVQVLGQPGELIGGFVSASQKVIANRIGSDMNITTTVEVGLDPDLRQRMQLINAQISLDQENLSKLTKIVRTLREMKEKMGDDFPKDKLELLVKSINSINTLNSQIPNLAEEYQELQDRMNESMTGSTVIARQILHAGVEVTMRDRKFYASRDFEKAVLVLEEGEIRMGGYRGEESEQDD